MNYCLYAVSLTYHLDVSRSNDSGIKYKVECIIVVSRHNFRVDCSGLESKTKKESSSADISELPFKGAGLNLCLNVCYVPERLCGLFSPSRHMSG
jgi:hypothetical protein